MAAPLSPTVVRAVGRWSLVAFVVNGIIGSGVFVLPGDIGGRFGWPALLAWVLAGLCTATMVLAFCEVSSRFEVAGGAYVYAQEAFGRFPGLQMAWMAYLVRCITAATQAGVFSTYLGTLWPWAGTTMGARVVTVAFFGGLAAVNIRGVSSGARASNLLAIAKTAMLLAVGVGGLAWLAMGRAVPVTAPTVSGTDGWLAAVLLLMFAFGGFESAVIAAAEAKDPRRDAPFAILTGLGVATLVYLAAQATVLATVANPAASKTPLADAATTLAGPVGATLVTLTALAALYGWLAAGMLNVPRMTMAMAERGDLPAVLARVHPRFRTPWVSIVAFASISCALALSASVIQNLSLSAVSRLFVYGGVCATLPVFRRWDRAGRTAVGGVVAPAAFRVPAGALVAVLGMGAALVLASRMTAREGWSLLLVATVATAHWGVVRWRGGTGDRRPPA
jgi:amino acid transporter